MLSGRALSLQFEGKGHPGHCAGLHSCATFRRVALPDLRGRSGDALVHERSGPSGSRVARPRPSSLSAVDDPTRLFDIQTDSLSSSLPRRESLVYQPHTIRMARFCNFMNAPPTDSGRFSPEPLTTKADRKSQKNWNLRAADPDTRDRVGGKESRSSDPFIIRIPIVSRIGTGGVRREVSQLHPEYQVRIEDRINISGPQDLGRNAWVPDLHVSGASKCGSAGISVRGNRELGVADPIVAATQFDE